MTKPQRRGGTMSNSDSAKERDLLGEIRKLIQPQFDEDGAVFYTGPSIDDTEELLLLIERQEQTISQLLGALEKVKGTFWKLKVDTGNGLASIGYDVCSEAIAMTEVK